MIGKKFDVLDQGFVVLREVMGTDADIAEIARISYGAVKNPSKDAALIDTLMRNRHTSPFEMPVLRFQIKVPIFVERQWVRHRTCSMNEMSGRYREMPEEFYVPELDAVRAQSKTNKQGRDEEILTEYAGKFIDHVAGGATHSFAAYHQDLQGGVAKELARIQLPLGTYTEKVWQMDLHNLLHFLKLRTDSHAQWEIQQYAKVIEEIVAEVFPMTYASWKNHVKDAVTFSADEMEIVLGLLKSRVPLEEADFKLDNATRLREFKKKLGL